MRRIIGMIAVAALVLAACGSDSGTAEPPEATDAPAATTSSEAPAAEDPTALGDEIGRVYVAGYGDVVALLADRPDAATALALLGGLKDAYVDQMVAFGHRREALDRAGRAEVDARINAALSGVPADTFAAYQQVVTDYAGDTEVANLIADFNIIGQYANFDLLREQEPEEAARLGIG